MKKIVLLAVAAFSASISSAQVNGRLMRYPDVSATKIAFVYGDDIWVVDKNGGQAAKLSSPPGEEVFPRFSPDGKYIAYTANYEGNPDVYLISSDGGIPHRLTYHGMSDRTLDWDPAGDKILFASSRESGRQRFSQFYTIDTAGGQPVKLPIPYGEYAAYSPDGQRVAFTDISRVYRTWKRYRGGMAADIHVFELDGYATSNITNNDANDEMPMWHGNTVYFLSDRGPEKRANIWKVDADGKNATQLTSFKDFDIHFPAIGPEDIVFQAGDRLYLLNLETEEYHPVEITMITDRMNLLPHLQNVAGELQELSLSPDGNRLVAEARGELFNVPAKEGFIADLSQTPGAAERYPAWSPDGKMIACWSDAPGEYQLMIYDPERPSQPRTVSGFKKGFRYSLYWSPDSKKLAFIDQSMAIQILEVATGKLTDVDRESYVYEGDLESFHMAWSPDSRWLVYAHEVNNIHHGIRGFDTAGNKRVDLTSGYYNDRDPAFSADGKYLFFTTSRNFSPVYSDLDNTFIYSNSTSIGVVPLNDRIPSLLNPRNDTLQLNDNSPEEPGDKEDRKGKKQSATETVSTVSLLTEGFERRMDMLDIPIGNVGALHAAEDRLYFMRYPNTGAPEAETASLNYYDFKEREEKTLAKGVSRYEMSRDGARVLLQKGDKWGVVEIKPGKEIENIDDYVPLDDLRMRIDPLKEWKQLFWDAWRMDRDFFYDPNMHGTDWEALGKQYGALISQANTRTDVNFIIGELIAELNSSHSYRGGGDLESSKQLDVGYLGADLEVENGKFRIKRIIEGAPWDSEVRSPLREPGTGIREGDYILAINGQTLDTSLPISAALQDLSEKTVELLVSHSADTKSARTVVIKTLASETRLRHLSWIEQNRKRVEEATNGEVGYVYVPSTGLDGQNELIRQYYAQLDKKAMIIDERFNSGGQIPDRFIELLNRKPLAFWAVRDGKDWAWPPVANFGPKVMLINGFSGSGGDAFPDYFRKAGLGPLIGTRTWGGLIGISGAPPLIDGGAITVPTFRMYNPDGTWFREGHGVDPDIKVVEDFQELARGRDVQLERAIEEIKKELSAKERFIQPERPSYEDRSK